MVEGESGNEQIEAKHDSIDIEALANAQKQHLAEIQKKRQDEEEAVARKAQAADDIGKLDALRKESLEIDDSLIGGASSKNIEDQKGTLEEMAKQIEERGSEQADLSEELRGIEESREKLKPLIEGLSDDEIAPAVKEAISNLDMKKNELSYRLSQSKGKLDELVAREESYRSGLSEKISPIERHHQLNQEASDLMKSPEVNEAVQDIAQRENEIRDTYVNRGVYQILEAERPERQASEAQKEFAREILQRYLDEEIERRGWNDLDPEERLKNINKLTVDMVEGMTNEPYSISSGNKNYEIQQLSNRGKSVVDLLHGVVVKSLLGSNQKSPSIALYPWAYASSIESEGVPQNLYDIIGYSKRDRLPGVLVGDESAKNPVDFLRENVLAHQGSLIKLKQMAEKQEYNADMPLVYRGGRDWSVTNGSMNRMLSEIGINAHAIAPKEWRRDDESYPLEWDKHNRQNEGFREITDRLAREAKVEDFQDHEKLLAKKEADLEKLNSTIEEVKKLEAERSKISDYDYREPSSFNNDNERNQIDQLRVQIQNKRSERSMVNQEVPNFWSGLTAGRRDKFYEQKEESLREIDGQIAQMIRKIEEIESLPKKRLDQYAEINQKIRQMIGATSLSNSQVQNDARRLQEEIDILKKNLESKQTS